MRLIRLDQIDGHATGAGREILYIGSLRRGGTSFSRAVALRKQGFKLTTFDTYQLLTTGNRIALSTTARFGFGSPLNRFNQALMREIVRLKSVDYCPDLVWVDKANAYSTPLIRRLRAAFPCPLLHYTPDSIATGLGGWRVRRHCPAFDYCVTTKEYDLELYEQLGVRNLVRVHQGVGDEILDFEEALAKNLDLVFVGHCQSHYQHIIKRIVDADISIKVWGPGWTKFAKRNQWAADIVGGDGLWGEDYVKTLASARIGLGLLSKRVPEVSTTRSFEIPAAGTALLAERSDEHLKLFEEDIEAVYFDGPDDLIKKVRALLPDSERLLSISRAGRKKCFEAGYRNSLIVGSVASLALEVPVNCGVS